METIAPQDDLLQALNQFTRRTHSADEVYIFDVLLCDNEIDRDFERFSLSALQSMKTLFVGKTGIFDHNRAGSNRQHAFSQPASKRIRNNVPARENHTLV